MLKKVLHRFVSLPVVYDQIQTLAGANKKRKIIRKYFTNNSKRLIVLDLGGGTGLYRDIWPSQYPYICLDSDMQKLAGFRQKYPQDWTLLADAGRIPLKTKTVDVIFCSSMSHHIPLEILGNIFRETARILKPAGKLIFLDAVLKEKSPWNKFLWALDRGEYPHTEESLRSCLEQHFRIAALERFFYLYSYFFIIGEKKNPGL